MQTSIYLAKLIGPVLIIVGAGILLNPRAFHAVARDALGNHALIYAFGLADLIIGIAIVLSHNVWTASWRVIITLLGWILIVRGAIRIAMPDRVMEMGAKLMESRVVLPISAAIMIVLGLILSYFGYSA
jgi:hypothetical protein